MPPRNQADRASIFYRMVNSVRGEETAEAEAEGGPLASGPDRRITVGLARVMALALLSV